VQGCSTLYKNGHAHLKVLVEFLEQWMDNKGYEKISDFRGMMNYGKIGDPDVYERSQFMKFYSSHE
jgi:dihydroorotate dehydrogenase (fumarate)